MIINNVVGLAKTAKVFNVPTILTTVLEERGAKGHAAINEALTSLLASLPSGFVFRSIGRAIGHHNIGRLKWRSGPPDGPSVVTGMDIAHFEGNLIHSLFVFLEPNDA